MPAAAYMRCTAQIMPPGMIVTVACGLEADHSGLHYYAETYPDVHVAISWYARLPIPQGTER